MNKMMITICLVVVVACLLSSSALAQSPLGPPVATLDKGDFAVGFGCAHSKGDVEGTVLGTSVTVEDIEVNTYMANFIWGIADNWELQFDLGASEYEDVDFSSSGDFAWGLGVKNTFAEQDRIKWGAVFTMHWYEAGASGEILGVPYTEEVSWSEIKIAAGPSYEDDKWRLYGGPFLVFIDGEGDYTVGGLSFSGDFEEESNVGGFVGAQVYLDDNTTLGVEYQLMENGNVIGASILYRF